MTCGRCGRNFDAEEPRCPHCGEPADAGGVFQTSAVLISLGGSRRFYRSVDEIPARLRSKLVKSTNGANAATILIADRRGRKEIARAMRSLPASAQRRLLQSILASENAESALGWLTPRRKRLLIGAVVLLALALIALAFAWRA